MPYIVHFVLLWYYKDWYVSDEGTFEGKIKKFEDVSI